MHESVLHTPLPSNSALYDSTAYDLGWNGFRDLSEVDSTILPSYDHALFLINAVKFHCGRILHLFDEEVLMQQLREFNQDATNSSKTEKLWYVHYLLLLAFGKAFVVQNNRSKTPASADFFTQAMKLLPHTTLLHAQPIQSIEVLCCAALYYQCLDFRGPAYNLVSHSLMDSD